MITRLVFRLAAGVLCVATAVQAQNIVAQSSGIPNPTGVFDFGAGLFPNFTPVTTQFIGITVDHARYFTTASNNNLVGGFLTNDFSGPPNTVTIRFGFDVTDLSFVYHQIGTSGPSTIRALHDGNVVGSITGTWNHSQPNNYFGFTNGLFDEVQIDFVTDFNIDTLAYRSQAAACIVYNGTGVNPLGFTCTASPVLGGTWIGRIATNPSTVLTVLGFSPAGLAAPSALFGGELLLPSVPPPMGFLGSGAYSMAIPTGAGWIGTAIGFQGFRVDSQA
ncbi:MAG: hypothetical protein KDC98_13335, partial [Planctomycetes bacterium]|nr:hypothetical protein [Planctomycetota bacterium]